MRRIVKYICAAVIITIISYHQAVALQQSGRVTKEYNDKINVNANLVNAGYNKNKNQPVVLLLHNVLSHYDSILMSSIQQHLAKQNISSLAINLSLNVNNRIASYDCKIPHSHKSSDAFAEIRFWTKWLSSQGVAKVALMGHMRSANQLAWYASSQSDLTISHLLLLAPYAWNRSISEKAYNTFHNKDINALNQKATRLIKDRKGNSFMDNVGMFYCKNSKATANSFSSYFLPDKRRYTPNLMAKIRVPTLILIGDEDRLSGSSFQDYQELSKIYRNINPKKVKSANHLFNSKKILERVSKDIKTFIQ